MMARLLSLRDAGLMAAVGGALALVFAVPVRAAVPVPVTVDVTPTVESRIDGTRLHVTLHARVVSTDYEGPVQLWATVSPHPDRSVAAETVFEEQVAASGVQLVPVPVTIAAAGVYEVHVYVTGGGTDHGFSDSALRYLIVSEDATVDLRDAGGYLQFQWDKTHVSSGYGLQSHPNDPEVLLHVQRAVETPLEDSASRPEPLTNADHTRISGTITYKGSDNKTTALVGAQVEIWEYDSGREPDKVLGKVSTGLTGDYHATVVNDDGPFGEGIDVYLIITLKNRGFTLANGAGPAVLYSWRTQIKNNITTSSTVINYSLEDDLKAADVWHALYRGSRLLHGAGRQPKALTVLYPGKTGAGTTYNPTTNTINIEAKYYQAPVVITHEYGHAVMDFAYNGKYPPRGPKDRSGFDTVETPAVAWIEGFATAYALMAVPEAQGKYIWGPGDARSIELFKTGQVHSTAKGEGWVAAGIWDLYDSPTDNNGGDPNRGRNGPGDLNGGNQLVSTKQVLDAMWGQTTQVDFASFWQALQRQLTTVQKEPSAKIMDYNYMP